MVDYTKDKFEQVYANDPFDVVLDLVGGPSANQIIMARNVLILKLDA